MIQKEKLAEALKYANAMKNYLAEMKERKLDKASLKSLRAIAMKGNQYEQGIQLKFRLTNISDAAVTLNYGGDATTNQLLVTGPGAVNYPFNGPMTREYRMGKSMTIEPGKSKEFTIQELKYGMRNASRWLISKAGDYQVTLSFGARIGKSRVELKSKPVALKIVSK